MSKALDLLLTTTGKIIFGIGGNMLKTISGGLAARNTADTADANLQADRFLANGDIGLVINADAANTGTDRSITIQRPTSGMTASITLTLPPSAGTTGQYMGLTSPGVLDWIAPPVLTPYIQSDSTVIAFNASSPIAMFTLPANARMLAIEAYITTPFTGGTGPTLSIGVTGNVASYAPATAFDLRDTAGAGIYEYNPTNTPSGSTTALIATLTANGATAGSVEIVCYYATPA